MFIMSAYQVVALDKSETLLIVSNETVPCPLCGHELAYRDSVKRIGLSYDRDRRIYHP